MLSIPLGAEPQSGGSLDRGLLHVADEDHIMNVPEKVQFIMANAETPGEPIRHTTP